MVRTYLFAGLSLLALCETLPGCGFDHSPGVAPSAGSPCVEGQTAKCDCAGVVSVCKADGTMGVCDCSGASSAGAAGDNVGGNVATGSGTGGKSSGGTGGGVVDSTGGVGVDSTGGVGVDNTGGIGVDSTGGVGVDNTGGVGADGTGGTGGVGPDPVPRQAGPYGACLATMDCKSPLMCTQLAPFQPKKPGYCAQSCTPGGGSGGGSPSECAQPESGNVKASCTTANGFTWQCTLESCKDKECPDGMHCVPTATSLGTVSNCGYMAN